MTIKLDRTNFDFKYYGAEERYNRLMRNSYVFHELAVFNEILINDQSFYCEYQTGVSYQNNDYNAPSNKLEIYEDNSCGLACLLHQMYEDYFEDDELINQKLEEAQKHCEHIKNIDDLFELYVFFNDNDPGFVEDYID